MIAVSILTFLLCYLFAGLLLWTIPHYYKSGYVMRGTQEYNMLFIPFWLPLAFSNKLDWLVSK